VRDDRGRFWRRGPLATSFTSTRPGLPAGGRCLLALSCVSYTIPWGRCRAKRINHRRATRATFTTRVAQPRREYGDSSVAGGMTAGPYFDTLIATRGVSSHSLTTTSPTIPIHHISNLPSLHLRRVVCFGGFRMDPPSADGSPAGPSRSSVDSIRPCDLVVSGLSSPAIYSSCPAGLRLPARRQRAMPDHAIHTRPPRPSFECPWSRNSVSETTDHASGETGLEAIDKTLATAGLTTGCGRASSVDTRRPSSITTRAEFTGQKVRNGS